MGLEPALWPLSLAQVVFSEANEIPAKSSKLKAAQQAILMQAFNREQLGEILPFATLRLDKCIMHCPAIRGVLKNPVPLSEVFSIFLNG